LLIGNILLRLLDAYSIIIIVYVILSWVPTKTGIFLEIYNFLGKICDPYLNIFRKFIAPIGGMVDISPIVALLVLQLVSRFIAFIFYNFGVF